MSLKAAIRLRMAWYAIVSEVQGPPPPDRIGDVVRLSAWGYRWVTPEYIYTLDLRQVGRFRGNLPGLLNGMLQKFQDYFR